MVPAWYARPGSRPSSAESDRYVAQRRDDGDSGAAGQLRAGRWCTRWPHEQPGRETRIDVVSNQYVVVGGPETGTGRQVAVEMKSRHVDLVRARDRRGVPGRPGDQPGWRALPVRALREPAMAGAVQAQGWTFWPLGLHALAPQAQCCASRRRRGPGGGVGAGRRTCVICGRQMTGRRDHAASAEDGEGGSADPPLAPEVPPDQPLIGPPVVP